MHDNEQVPGGWEDEQLPRPPFAGGDTGQFVAFTDIGRLSRAAASHQINRDPSFFIAVPLLIKLML